MTATLQDSQKEKESDSDTNDNDIDSVRTKDKETILAAKKMMSKIKKHAIEDNCSCCKRTLEID